MEVPQDPTRRARTPPAEPRDPLMFGTSRTPLATSPLQEPSTGTRDYFAQPSLSSSPSAMSWMRARDDNGRQWTVFGQLLEDDRTPGIRGSDTPVATLRHRTSQPSILQHPLIPHSPSGSNLAPVLEPPNGRSSSPKPPSDVTEIKLNNGLLDRPRSRPTSRADGDFQRAYAEDSASYTGPAEYSAHISEGHSSCGFLQRWYRSLPTMTPLQRNITKCTVAYFIGSLFTYWPLLSGLLSDIVPLNSSEGPSPSGHMVATVVVYFNPAKTLGAMFEADTFCLIGAIFSSVVCLTSFGVFWFFEERPGVKWLADVSVFLCIGAAMAFVAWSKHWMQRPSFNTACSMASIMIFIVVVREGGADLLVHVLFIILLGSAITNLVCFLLWPQSAATALSENMIAVLDSFATLLDMTKQTFLLQEMYTPDHKTLRRAVEAHQASFTSLKKNLVEAKSEWSDRRMRAAARTLEGSDQELYDAAIDGLTRLAQHLNGLRDGTRLQFEMVAQGFRDSKGLSAAHEVNGTGKLTSKSSEVFEEIVKSVGSPLNALAEACIDCLRHMQKAFNLQKSPGTNAEAVDPSDFQGLGERIVRALFVFDSTSNQAILRLFRRFGEAQLSDVTDSTEHDGYEDNEGVFVVYFFMFTLQEFARELVGLAEIVAAIRQAEQDQQHNRRTRIWSYLSGFFMKPAVEPITALRSDEETVPTGPHLTPRKTQLRKKISALVSTPSSKGVAFPKVRPHAPNTIQTPGLEMLSRTGRLKKRFWDLGARLRETDMKYAIKCGLGLAILASPAFIEASRPTFLRYRGEWSLISFFVVLSPTMGQTNYLSVHRILGTMLGAITAAAIYSLAPHNPYVLSVFGAFFSIPCFYYIITQPTLATSARFVLLAYNLTALFCFNSRLDGNIDPVEIAFRRVVAVSFGVIWALVVSRWWWPTEARRELTQKLSDFCLNVGWLYTKLVSSYSSPADDLMNFVSDFDDADDGVKAAAMSRIVKSTHEFMSMELHLQIELINLQSLLTQAQHEPRLKGPFPVHLYRTVLTSLQVILDKLHSMRCVTTQEEWFTIVRRDFVVPVNPQRREMVGNVLLYFSTLAAAFSLKRALPPYLPPAEKSRQRLVAAIRQLDIVKERRVEQSHYLLYFAYALMMKGVIHELDYLGRTLQEAFGVIGQSVDQFEDLFSE